jgi:hypothetical protein
VFDVLLPQAVRHIMAIIPAANAFLNFIIVILLFQICAISFDGFNGFDGFDGFLSVGF